MRALKIILQKFTVSSIQINKVEDMYNSFPNTFLSQYLQATITFLLLPYCHHSETAEYPCPGNKEKLLILLSMEDLLGRKQRQVRQFLKHPLPVRVTVSLCTSSTAVSPHWPPRNVLPQNPGLEHCLLHSPECRLYFFFFFRLDFAKQIPLMFYSFHAKG